ncbi:MAG: tRNA pseudouridine(38-40) synthase TruA [Firmicutes bacterium]|nr:tRNA pseudouridine(38-40) synthase TruA [Bacillota bacterium]
MQRVKLTISYDGSSFCGFQRQGKSEKLPSVQEAVETAIFQLCNQKTSVLGSGRTDAGVHALGQVCHFDLPENFNITPEKIIKALNTFLPEDVKASNTEFVSNDFHAIKSAKRKSYFYDLYLSKFPIPPLDKHALQVCENIDVEKMKECAKIFIGTHDFIAFRAKHSTAKTTAREVFECYFERFNLYGVPALRFNVTADGFLYKMVRIIIGTLIRAGEGHLTIEEVKKLLDDGKEWMAKVPAPANGLFLKGVEY